MKILIQKKKELAILLISIFSVCTVTAGEVTHTFSTGDTLTAENMTEVKSAVNDNFNSIKQIFGGDGSAGDLLVSANIDWGNDNNIPVNPNFANITVDAGQTLFVPSRTTIRCNGNFVNNGTVSVSDNFNAGSYVNRSNMITTVISLPHAGDSTRAAGSPYGSINFDTNPGNLSGGFGGGGIPKIIALTSYNKFQFGGGGGSAHQSGTGGFGGGFVKIKCNGSVTNNGVITANAGPSNPGGGGGGGIVILSSLLDVNNSGSAVINADGGNGGDSRTANAAAGGGGGGIIILAAPVVTNDGVTSVEGGSRGSGAILLTQPVRSGGGAGGASGGDGGKGGSMTSSGTSGNAALNPGSGSRGYVLEIEATPLFN